MDDYIKVGLDFGTHQTKICIQRTPDEGHGQPSYEFFKFKDLNGNEQYFLPSIVQINEDDTLSYGYVDKNRMKSNGEKPVKEEVVIKSDFDINEETQKLIEKYSTYKDNPEDIRIMSEMLEIRKMKMKREEEEKERMASEKYQKLIKSYEKSLNIFRYFKQAVLSKREWNLTIPSKTLSIWYIAYIIFLLEEKYGTNFSINMGVPTDDNYYNFKQKIATEILASAYYLVEDVFHNDIDTFLKSTVEELKEKTEFKKFSQDLKDEYVINIFPEAYASLIGLTSRGKIADGMSLTADMGGGTTDITFFTIQENKPVIYKYWSIDCGLNYIAEKSGFDYSEGNFENKANKGIIGDYNSKKIEIGDSLIRELRGKIAKTAVSQKELDRVLKDRVLVYSGGGSTFKFMNTPILTFTDIKILDDNIWKEENIIDKAEVSKMISLLITAYGLSVGKDDNEVKLKDFREFMKDYPSIEYEDNDGKYISKDQC